MRSKQALYRRYRPEVFSEMIGQECVTSLLSAALDNNRLGHAYLFSGPRGCGKTTSARVFARCLNCVKGPTSKPCGKCRSCIDLGRGGGGSLDVIEIDAASHNGVEDARALRERAIFAPSQSRFRIFILDEAHMVTTQGFNALLKIVEEPPAHVKFIFATTEPEKVLGTIRSRTFSYPFSLVAPGVMQPYIADICTKEKIAVEDGVVQLVVRAGGGSVRDTLSILDQLMVGKSITYTQTTDLLRLAPDALVYELFCAIANANGASAFACIEKVAETGYEPMYFVEDLMLWVRDITIAACNGQAVFSSYTPERVEHIGDLASKFSLEELDVMGQILLSRSGSFSGTISPRLLLEIMLASLLIAISKTRAGNSQVTDDAQDRMGKNTHRKGFDRDNKLGASGVRGTANAKRIDPDGKTGSDKNSILLDDWSCVLGRLKPDTAALLHNSRPLRVTDAALTIGMPQEVLPQFVADKNAVDDLKNVLHEITGVHLRLSGKPIETGVDENQLTGEAVLMKSGAKLISNEEG